MGRGCPPEAIVLEIPATIAINSVPTNIYVGIIKIRPVSRTPRRFTTVIRIRMPRQRARVVVAGLEPLRQERRRPPKFQPQPRDHNQSSEPLRPKVQGALRDSDAQLCTIHPHRGTLESFAD